MKIAIIGAGNVGACTASLLITKKMCKNVTLIDINSNLAKARAIDLAQLACVFDVDASVSGGDDYELIRNYDIAVITAGFARKNNQSRDELCSLNAKIVAEAAQKIVQFAPNAIIIVVTNPLDLMVWTAFKASKFSEKRVIGMAGELDSARFKYELASEFKIKFSSVKAKTMGLHGETMFFPHSKLSLGDVNSDERLSEFTLEKLENKARNGGAKIVNLSGGSAFYAPAAGVVKMCEAITRKSNEILSCCVIKDNVPLGRLVRLDKYGVAEILEVDLSKSETEKLELNSRKITHDILNLN